ncbi:MAG: DUF3387 domain-containing protein [Candidatus Omnitrophica bacterium]|nr:DUF3387 domain-containing protein [Candidatus Omnitrophota bacterium]
MIINLEEKKKEFSELIKEGKVYLDLIDKKIDDKAVEKIMDYFSEVENRQEFIKFYMRLQELYEIISPDIFLRPYLEDYFLLSGILKILKIHFGPKIPEALLRKTIELIQAHIDVSGLEKTLPVYPINEQTLNIIQQDFSPERLKIIKLHRSIMILIDVDRKKEPFLLLFRERLQKILEEFETKQIGTKEALSKLKELIEEINKARKEKDRLKLEQKDFAYYFALKDYIEDEKQREESATKINRLFLEHSNWMENPDVGRILRRKLFGLFISLFKRTDNSLYVMSRVIDLEREIEKLKEKNN